MKTRATQLLQIAKIIILALLLAFGISYLYAAWSPPTATPPSGNTPAPVNVGSTAQVKSGGFEAQVLKSIGLNIYDVDTPSKSVLWVDGIINKRVGIGTVSPGDKLEIFGTGAGLLLKSAANDIGDIVFQESDGNQKGRIWTGAGAADEKLFLSTGDNTADITIDAAGNVGIGTAAPQGKIHADITARTTAFSAGDGTTWHDLIIRNPTATLNAAAGIAFEVTTGYHPNAGTGIAAVRSNVTDFVTDMVFVTRPASAGAAERMRITSTGNVGIGVPVPGQKLDVAGNVKGTGLCIGTDCRTAWPAGSVTSVGTGVGLTGGPITTTGTVSVNTTSIATCTGATQKILWDSTNSRFTCGTDGTGGGGDITGVIAGTGLLGGGLSGDVTLNADATYLQRRVTDTCTAGQSIRTINSDGTVVCEIDDTGAGGDTDWTEVTPGGTGNIYRSLGNVGIGTNNPLSKLDVNGTISGTLLSIFSGPSYFGGNVGIGLANPQARLHVLQGSVSPSLILSAKGNTSNDIGGLEFRKLDGTVTANFWKAAGASDPLRIKSLNNIQFHTGNVAYDASAPQMTINTSGNVGIGTTIPGAKLEVAGQVKITGGTPGVGEVLTSNATGLGSWEVPANGFNYQVFTSNGTFTVPAGVTKIEVEAWGGGGGGGSANGMAGGGGGGYVLGIYNVSPGASYTVTVGVGGRGGFQPADGKHGEDGGDTKFGSLLTAGGGGGARYCGITYSGGPPYPSAGGSASGGILNILGENGGKSCQGYSAGEDPIVTSPNGGGSPRGGPGGVFVYQAVGPKEFGEGRSPGGGGAGGTVPVLGIQTNHNGANGLVIVRW